MIRIRRALFSTYAKEGLLPLARECVRRGVEILASGGTARHLESGGVPVTAVESLTGFGELFGGRVKTLHPRIHGGILFRREVAGDREEAERAGIEPIDLVVVNLYPFADALARRAGPEETIELIDIGGPALVRAAAKNHASVAVVTLPDDYERVRAALEAGEGALPPELCRELAARAFAVTAAYDAAIAGYLRTEPVAATGQDSGRTGATAGAAPKDSGLPETFECRAPRNRGLRYGENPSQQAALYGAGASFPFDLVPIHGKELSYNNLLDLGCGRDVLGELGGELAAVVIKHAIPCGVAVGTDLAETYAWARACDSLSAFGGVVLFNREIDASTAALLNETFLEVVLAPGFAEDALPILKRKKKRALVQVSPESLRHPASALRSRSIGGGWLVQTPLPAGTGETGWEVVTERSPDDRQRRDLVFGWRVLKHVRSNGVLFARDGRTLGIGSGQSSRIDAVESAVHKAEREGHSLAGSVFVSDAFFPFSDCVERAAEVGAAAVMQPGGSVRDGDSIEACNRRGLAMVCNGQRVFSHG